MDDMNHEIHHIVGKDGEKKLIKKRGPSYWISIILAFLLLGSVIMNVLLLLFLGTFAGMAGNFASAEDSNYDEVYLMGDEKSKNKVVQIALVGVIFDAEETSRARDNIVTRIKSELKIARKDEHVKALLLLVDSPGGGITASDILWNELKQFKKTKKIPVVAYCKDVTASGGYYVATQADYIMAHDSSIVGNIGVISEFMNAKVLLDKIGVEMNVIKSQTFDQKESVKDIGSPFRPMKTEERKMLQNMINEMWGRFVDVVAEGRKGKLTHKEVEEIADGSIFTGKGAMEKKLIDGLGYKEDAFEQSKKMAGLSDARLVKYRYKYTPLQELFASQLGGPKKIQLFPEYEEYLNKRVPRLMYLWTME